MRVEPAEYTGAIDADLDDATAAELWSDSGARWLTSPDLLVPSNVVKRVVGLTASLDQQGAGIAELVPARGLGLLAERAALMGLPRSGRISAGGATQLIPTADNWIVVSLARPDDIELIPAWLEHQPAIQDDPWTVVHQVAATRNADDLIARAGILGLPCGIVDEVNDARPAIVTPLGPANPRPVTGAIVVNLAGLWAGPLGADILARLGARTITVESTRRPDGGRLARRFFAALHGRTESVALDLSTTDGHNTLRELLSVADVVIEGSRPRALQQMGIDAADLTTTGPQLWVSITSHGRDHDHAHRVGFGDDAAASGGLVGWHQDEPQFIADAIADPLTGLTAAATVANLLNTGGRWLIDIALARVARSTRGPWTPHIDRPASRPQPRTDPGGPLPLGLDTANVLTALSIGSQPRR